MRPMVLDGSMTLGFLLEDERFSGALEVLEVIEAGAPTYVPCLWWHETANALLMSERRKRSTQAGTVSSLQAIQDLPISVDEEPVPHAAYNAVLLARQYGLTVYDATYLELAIRKGCALATADKRLAKAAVEAGVKLVGAAR
jgi:predicted nucleic acid-binding protein